MWGYMIGICMIIDGEQQCEDKTFIPDFSTEYACEVHSVLQTTLINYDLWHLDGVYDIWVAPTNCIEIEFD
jgi:hypothetical protein